MTVPATAEGHSTSESARAALKAVSLGNIRLEDGYAASEAEQTASEANSESAFTEALSLFKQARAADPDLPQVYLGMGRAHYALGRFDQARASFDRVRKVHDDNADAHLGSARALLRLGRETEAMERLRRVTELSPAFRHAWVELGDLLTEHGDHQRSVELLDEAVQANDKNAELVLTYASKLQRVGELAEALAQCERAALLADAPNQVGTRTSAMLLAGALLVDDMDRAGDALGHFEAAFRLAEGPSSSLRAQASYGAGLSLSVLKRYDEAMESLERAGKEDSVMAMFSLTAQFNLLRGLGRYEQAWKVLAGVRPAAEEALKAGLASTDPGYARSYGAALRSLGDLRGAVTVHREAIAANPTDAGLRVELIATYLEERDADPEQRGGMDLTGRNSGSTLDDSRAALLRQARDEFARARVFYDQALDANRTPRHLVSLGVLLMLMGHDDQALPLMLEAISIGRELPTAGLEQEQAHAYLAMAYTRSGDYARAVREFKISLNYDPDEFLYQLGAAEGHLRLGHLGEAERRYRSIRDAAPGNVEARIGLAEVFTAQGDAGEIARYQQAVTEFNEAIRLANRATDSVPELREGSRSLGNRKLATLHHEMGYAHAKLYEDGTAGGALSRQGPNHLAKASKAFKQALVTDSTHAQAAAALERIKEERRQLRSRKLYGSWAPWLVVGLCVLVLVFVHLFLFWPLRDALPATFRDHLGPATYGMLVFGLLVLLIAGASLPQLLKLSVAGVAIEKAAVEQSGVHSQLGIGRESELASLVPIKVWAAAHVDTPSPRGQGTGSPRDDGSRQPTVQPKGGRAVLDAKEADIAKPRASVRDYAGEKARAPQSDDQTRPPGDGGQGAGRD